MVESEKEKIRFAVVGLGNIAQEAVLPAFEHASDVCELVALVSSDPQKRAQVGREYGIEHSGSYDDLERIFDAADVDAAYIALPNTQHRAMTERCAAAGVHVLCEKPMAMREEDCVAMVDACDAAEVELMIAYRLHFDPANLRALQMAQSGQLGDLRFFSSTFGQEVREGDIRTLPELGGGALFDMGIYCVNAARSLFRAEPEEVRALQCAGHDGRLKEVDETTVAILRFPGDRLAQLTASQGSGSVDSFRIVGTDGSLRVEPAYMFGGERVHHLRIGDKKSTERFEASDQFAPELVYFARCILHGDPVEPSGEEGLADVRVLQAIQESARTGRAVRLAPMLRSVYPGVEQEIRMPPARKHPLVNAPSPAR